MKRYRIKRYSIAWWGKWFLIGAFMFAGMVFVSGLDSIADMLIKLIFG